MRSSSVKFDLPPSGWVVLLMLGIFLTALSFVSGLGIAPPSDNNPSSSEGASAPPVENSPPFPSLGSSSPSGSGSGNSSSGGQGNDEGNSNNGGGNGPGVSAFLPSIDLPDQSPLIAASPDDPAFAECNILSTFIDFSKPVDPVSVGGYLSADALCDSTYPNSHVCSSQEMILALRCRNAPKDGDFVYAFPGVSSIHGAWVNSGVAPDRFGWDYTLADCGGWDNTPYSMGGQLFVTKGLGGESSVFAPWSCGIDTLPFACCGVNPLGYILIP